MIFKRKKILKYKYTWTRKQYEHGRFYCTGCKYCNGNGSCLLNEIRCLYNGDIIELCEKSGENWRYGKSNFVYHICS